MPNYKAGSIDDARRQKRLEQFAEQHPSKGDEPAFDALLTSMASGKPKAKDRTSGEASGEG